MQMEKLVDIMQNAGIAGAGGAGFPAYAKLSRQADTVLLNCSECEPLIRVHRQLLEAYAYEILTALDTVCEAIGASQFIVAVKGSYTGAVQAVSHKLANFKRAKLFKLPEVYPVGDEIMTIYEATGRLVQPGQLPVSAGVIVYNVETMLNLYHALLGTPVTHKYVTVAGAVAHPLTVKAAIGTPFSALVASAGGCDMDAALISGGPMTGAAAQMQDVVTKTTNAVLVLPKYHPVVMNKHLNANTGVKRAMSACCQCQMCTDLCPRHLMGYPIEPHLVMRTLALGDTLGAAALLNTAYCSQCGLCELYACMQGLSPRTLIGKVKGSLKALNAKPEPPKEADIHPARDLRKVPEHRLIARLGLAGYDVDAPLSENPLCEKTLTVKLSQHIGAPAVPVVKMGDQVFAGQTIAAQKEGALSLPVHAPVPGRVTQVANDWITIERQADTR